MRTHTVKGGGGLRLHVREWGNADGPPILFMHGLSQNHLGSVFIGAVPQTYLGTGRALSEDPYSLFPQFSKDGFDFPPATLQVLPLGRGQGLFYRGIGHQDVRDVLADVQKLKARS